MAKKTLYIRCHASGLVPGGVVSAGMVMEDPDIKVLHDIPHVLITEDEYNAAHTAKVFGTRRPGIVTTTVEAVSNEPKKKTRRSPKRATVTDIRAAIAELRRVPIEGEVKNTVIDLRGKLTELYREMQDWIDLLAAARRRERGGAMGPRRREVF